MWANLAAGENEGPLIMVSEVQVDNHDNLDKLSHRDAGVKRKIEIASVNADFSTYIQSIIFAISFLGRKWGGRQKICIYCQ